MKIVFAFSFAPFFVFGVLRNLEHPHERSETMRDITIAAVCMHSRPGKIRENTEKTEGFIREASRAGAEIVCFPELSLTGYVLDSPEKICPPERSEEIIQSVARMARDHGIGILAGTIEWQEGRVPYITQVLAGPEGVVERYRKTHLSPQEKKVYRSGETLEVFSIQGASIGLVLCYEAHFPEISTLLALKGAEILFMPHASPRGQPQEKAESWLRHLTARAFDNAVFVLACNQVGKYEEGMSFPGVALALAPSGRIMGRYEGEEESLMVVEFSEKDLREVRGHRMRYFLPNRRPELYRGLGPEDA